MSIARLHRKRHNFSIIDNSAAEDSRLSWKARGMLWYLLTKPDGWTVRMTDLIRRSDKDGRDSVRAGFKELEELGYAIRWRSHDPKTGQFDWVTEIFETLEDAEEWKSHHSGLSVDGLAVDGKPVDIVITDSAITDQVITEEEIKKKKVKRFQEETPFSFSEEDSESIQDDESFLPGCEPKQKSKPPTDSANSEEDQKFRESQNESNQSKRKTEKPKLKYDDDGYLRIPTTGKNRLAGALTLRTLQIAILAEHGLVEWMQDGRKAYMSHVDDDEWMAEEEFLKDYPIARLKAKNGYGELDFTVEWYNWTAERWFKIWQRHVAQFPEWTIQDYPVSLMVREDLKLNFVDE